jgi:hypothetical protein
MSNRHTVNSEDRALMDEIKKSTNVSSYIGGVYDAITTGDMSAAKSAVPNYGPGVNAGHLSAHESGGLPMDMQGVFVASQNILGEEGTAQAMKTAYAQPGQPNQIYSQAAGPPSQKPSFKVSENQFRAIQKYPTLVEFLGSDNGDGIAQQVMKEINGLVVKQIEQNSQLINPEAKMCVANRQNLNQFFQGDGWVCQVTARGPFMGNEAFFYKHDEDKAFILRRHGNKYENVTQLFNVTNDYRTTAEELGADSEIAE